MITANINTRKFRYLYVTCECVSEENLFEYEIIERSNACSACMLIYHKGHTDTIHVYSVTVMTLVKALQAGHSSQGTSEPITPATVPEIIKICYNCGGERQTFARHQLTPINAGLPLSSEGLPLSCEGPPSSSVLLPPCCGTRKRRQQGGITALWDGIPTLRDGRPTLWDGRPTLCEGRPALRNAIGRHGALWDGWPTLWDGITVSLSPASEGLPPSNAN